MKERLYELRWEEAQDGRARTFHVHRRVTPEGSITMAILGGLATLFVTGVIARTGGPVFWPGLILIFGPVVFFAVIALLCDVADLRGVRLRIDPERVTCGSDLSKPDWTRATADVGGFSAEPYGSVLVRDREGRRISSIGTCAPSYVSRRLQEALDDARAPRTYRG